MPKAKLPHTIYAEKLCKKYPEHGDRTIARMVNKKFPEIKVESIRTTIRNFRGHGGDDKRKVKDKELFKPLEYNYKKTNLYKPDSKEYISAQKRKLSKSKYYIVTWAQNNTPVHKDFLNNIESYAKFLGAEIHVILGRYKNPTSIFQGKTDEHWANEILPYADAKRHKIHKYLQILSDIKVQPTASNPLSSLESISGQCNAVFGHPKVALSVIPALEGYAPKIIMTTGSVTVDNYTDSKAGKKGEFHHTLGFVIVEIKDSEIFFIRQVTALSNGSFTDLVYNLKDGKVKKIDKIKAAILGDIHVGDDCKIVNTQQRKWLDRFKPKHTLIHDIFNGHSVNHHEEKDPIKQYQRHLDGSNLVDKEVNEMMEWVKSMLKYNLVFAAANHSDWLDKFIKSMDWKKSIHNARNYVEYAGILLGGDAPKGLIAYLLSKHFGNKVITLGRTDSFRINDWELSQHFDIGANGSKGSLGQFRKLSTKMVGGHSHTPARADGVLYVGTSTRLRVGYNIGASSWLNADVIIHEDKKAQHIIYMGDNKEFTTFKF